MLLLHGSGVWHRARLLEPWRVGDRTSWNTCRCDSPTVLSSLAERGRWLRNAWQWGFFTKVCNSITGWIERWRLDSLSDDWLVRDLTEFLRFYFLLHLEEAIVWTLELVFNNRLTIANHARYLMLCVDVLVLHWWSPVFDVVLWCYSFLDIHRSSGFGSFSHDWLAFRVKSWVHAEDATDSEFFLACCIVVLALNQVRFIAHLLFLLRLRLWHCACIPSHRVLLLVLCEANSLIGPGRRWLIALAATSTPPIIQHILRPIKGFSSDRVDLVYNGVKQLLLSKVSIVL